MTLRSKYIILSGGLDLQAPPLSLDPGMLIRCKNFEQTLEGGYRYISGYSRVGFVPGEGPVLGVNYTNGDIFAIRKDVGAAQATLYKYDQSTSSFSSVAGGLPDGGVYDFENHNFLATGSPKMYFCNGNGKAYESDGTSGGTVAITTGSTPDTPSFVKAHRDRLFLGFSAGSVQCSVVGNPTDFSGASGAVEIGVSDEVTGFANVPGDTLAVYCRNRIVLFQGDVSASGFVPIVHSRNQGAVPRSIQEIATNLFFDDRGMVSLSTSQAYGDFVSSDLARRINPFLLGRTTKVKQSVLVKSKGQYRLFFDDRWVLTLTFAGNKLFSATTQYYEHPVECITRGEDSAGNELVYFGSNDGYVYQLDSGTSFDGTPIDAEIGITYHAYGTPINHKRFTKATAEFSQGDNVSIPIKIFVDFDTGVGRSDVIKDITVGGGSAVYDSAIYDSAVYSEPTGAEAETYLNGYGRNMAITLRVTSDTVKPFSVDSVIVYYKLLGQVR